MQAARARSKLLGAGRAVRAAPWVIAARWRLRRTTDLRVLLDQHDLAPRRARSPIAVESLRRGTDAALRLVGPKTDHCVPRGLALFAQLTRHGYGATFVSGVRRTDGSLEGHAWVLVDGEPVEAQGSPDPASIYAEQFRYESGRRG
jgi:hypothetical protein